MRRQISASHPTLLFILSLILLPLSSNSWGQQDGDAEASGDEIREQTIYIPYEKLREVFEREGRGVFLPYDEFQRLWESARKATQSEPEVGPPVDSIVTEIISTASVTADVVTVDATLKIELLKEGWNRVPLRLSGAAIESARINGLPARITTADGGGYDLLYNNEQDGGQAIELQLTYARAYQKSPGQNSVAFAAPQAPVNRWTIRIPQSGVKVDVSPMIAASEATGQESESGEDEPENGEAQGVDGAPDAEDNDAEDNDAEDSDAEDGDVEEGAESDETAKDKDETVLIALVGSAAEVAIRWTPKSEGASGLTALTSVQSQQQVIVTEGAVRTRTTLNYSISRADLDRLVVDVPMDQKVVNVFDPNVRKWEVTSQGEGEAATQRITIELFESATSQQRIAIELEKFLDSDALGELSTPTVQAVDVGRQQGVVVVKVDQALRAETTNRTGLVQMDASELPKPLDAQSWNFAYRYASMPFDLDLSLSKIEPRITAHQLVECYIEPRQTSMDVTAIYTIEQAGVFQLEFEVPAGFEILQVRGKEIAGATAATVDNFYTEGENDDRLIVTLSRKALGQVAVTLHLQQQTDDPNLLSPTGSASTFDLDFPTANQTYLTQLEGELVVYAPQSLRVNAITTTGVRAISLAEAMAQVPSCREGRFATAQPTLTFAYSDQDRQLTLEAERRNPYVTARQMMTASIDTGVVKYSSKIFFDVQYSGVGELRIDVPTAIADQINNVGQKLREQQMDPQPDDVDDGYVAWSLKGESELLGRHMAEFQWEQKIEELDVGSSLEIDLPRIASQEVERAWGQVVFTKTESLDVEPSGTLEGLRPIDPVHDLMPDARVANAARAFEFYDAWSLKLKATRYQLEEVKGTSIERALISTVITRSDQRTVQCLYRLRSARQRLQIQLPDDVEFDSQPARINGRPVALERGDQGTLHIPLTGQDANSDFVLELRYTVSGSYEQIDVPEFPEDPAIQKIYCAVYLPEELRLLHSGGPWTEEFGWHEEPGPVWVPNPNRSEATLVSWIKKGINVASSPAFQTDGTLHLYSAIKPGPPPDGSLKLQVIHHRTLAAIIIACLAVVGLIFLRSSWTTKLAVIALCLMAAVACGVFAPTLGRQLANLPMFAGLLMVGIAWAGWSVVRTVNFVKDVNWRSAFTAEDSLTTDEAPSNDDSQEKADASQSEHDSQTADENGGTDEKE